MFYLISSVPRYFFHTCNLNRVGKRMFATEKSLSPWFGLVCNLKYIPTGKVCRVGHVCSLGIVLLVGFVKIVTESI